MWFQCRSGRRYSGLPFLLWVLLPSSLLQAYWGWDRTGLKKKHGRVDGVERGPLLIFKSASSSGPHSAVARRVLGRRFSSYSWLPLPSFWGSFSSSKEQAFCLCSSRNIMFSQLWYFGSFWQEVGWAGVEITHECSLNKKPGKYSHLASGFCWLQGHHCKPTNTNCFHICSHF